MQKQPQLMSVTKSFETLPLNKLRCSKCVTVLILGSTMNANEYNKYRAFKNIWQNANPLQSRVCNS